MTRGAAYYRKSNDDEGESIAQQTAWAKDATTREGVTIVAVFQDQSVSGWDTARRSGFREMIAFCQEQARAGNPIACVVCWKANRFSRADSLETARFLCDLRDAGVTRMLTAERWVDFQKPEDRMIFGLQQEATEHRYALNLSSDTKRGKRATAAKGLWNGGKPPYGYRVEGQKLILHPDEVETVRTMFGAYATEDVSIRGLADRLNRAGIATPTGKRLWRPATVGKILGNVLYLGDMVFGRRDYSPFAVVTVPTGKPVKPSTGRRKNPGECVTKPNSHPALIDRATFDRVQTRLANNRGRKSPRKTAPFALSGLLVCGNCGKRMVAQTCHVKAHGKVHKYRSYTGASYHVHGVASGCARNTVDETRMLAGIGRKLATLITPDAVSDLKAALIRQEQEAAGTDPEPGLAAPEADLTRRVGRLIDQLEDDLPGSVLADVRERIKTITGERDKVRAELAPSAPRRGRSRTRVSGSTSW